MKTKLIPILAALTVGSTLTILIAVNKSWFPSHWRWNAKEGIQSRENPFGIEAIARGIEKRTDKDGPKQERRIVAERFAKNLEATGLDPNAFKEIISEEKGRPVLDLWALGQRQDEAKTSAMNGDKNAERKNQDYEKIKLAYKEELTPQAQLPITDLFGLRSKWGEKTIPPRLQPNRPEHEYVYPSEEGDLIAEEIITLDEFLKGEKGNWNGLEPYRKKHLILLGYYRGRFRNKPEVRPFWWNKIPEGITRDHIKNNPTLKLVRSPKNYAPKKDPGWPKNPPDPLTTGTLP